MSSIPGNDYFDFQNNRWRDGAAENWAQNHQINQETGELEGDYPLPPHEVARGYQAMHDRAVWNYRRRLMDQGRQQMGDATNFQKGALGLLQSYRSGGGAALEAGIYNQVAGGMRAEGSASFQQAQMTQPLDLMSDLRRHEGAIAARRADRANERMMIASIVGNGSVSFGAQQAPASDQSGNGSPGGLGGDVSGVDGGTGGSATGAAMLQDEATVAGQNDGPNPLEPGGPQPGAGQGVGQGSPFAGQGNQEGGQGMNTQVEPFGQQGGVGGAGAGGGANQPVPGGGAGGGVGAPTTPAATMGAPGADGNFSTDAFAAASAAAGVGSPLGVMGRVDLNHFLVDMYESDPFYQSLPFAIQAEWRKRLGGAA